MKLCFICLDLYTFGGIQRVLTSVLNEIVRRDAASITVVMPVDKDHENIFGLNDKIEIVDYSRFGPYGKNSPKSLIAKALQRLNRETGIFENIKRDHFIENIYFSKSVREGLTNYINENNFDIAYGVGDSLAMLLASIRQGLNCKCVGWMHSTFELYYLSKGDLSFGLYNYCRRNLKKLDYLLVLTDKDKQTFQNNFGIKSIKLSNPVDYFCEEPSTSIDNPIVFTGRMIKDHKGLDYLVEIIEKIHEKDPDKKFVIVGDGKDFDWIKTRIHECSLSDVVTLTGARNDVDKILREGSLFIHTSRWEGFGVVIIEAMMFGLPVVAFHNNGPDEIIEDGVDGYLVDRFDCDAFADKVLGLLAYPDHYKRMSKKANEKAKNFSPEIIAGRFLEICRDN